VRLAVNIHVMDKDICFYNISTQTVICYSNSTLVLDFKIRLEARLEIGYFSDGHRKNS
jgi:hypothetical protein